MTALLRQAVGSAGGKLVMGILVVLLAVQGYTYAVAPGKVDQAVWDVVEAEGDVKVLVELNFPPERFHILAMQKHGRITGTEGNAVELRSVTHAGIQVIARLYWVRHISLHPDQ